LFVATLVLNKLKYNIVKITSTIAQRVVEGDEKGTTCPGLKLDHPVTEGHKYRDLVLQVVG
jgi:hypothetical protein